MRIILTLSSFDEEGALPDPLANLCSRSTMRDSSRAMVLFRSSTAESCMGAIVAMWL